MSEPGRQGGQSDAALDRDAVVALLTGLPDWTLAAEGDEIRREFRFQDYYRTLAFVNAVAWIAHREDHHPDLEVGYNRCLVRYRTHSVSGLSRKDFRSAAQVDALLQVRE